MLGDKRPSQFQINGGVYEHWVEFRDSVPNDVSVQFIARYIGDGETAEALRKFQMILSKDDLIRLGSEFIRQGQQ